MARRCAVDRAEAYLLAHLDIAVPVSKLSRIAGVSERALRNAFYTVRGVSPKKWIVGQRLRGARQALQTAGAGPATVTEVAAAYGFYEFGRFASTYRKAFGESPSHTLRSRRPASANSSEGTRPC